MSPHVTFRVLGPLEVLVDGTAVAVTAGKQRTVLAALLLRANRTVTIDELIDELWDERAPSNGRSTVQKYVMRVRRFLEDLGAGPLISTQPGGYRIAVMPGELDLDRFTDLLESAGQAARREDTSTEVTLLAEALGLWTAVPPMANVHSLDGHRHEAAGLMERYLHALDRRIELDLLQDRHSDVLAELAHLTRRYPHRERFWAHRIRALHRCGRQGEALTVHCEIVRLLAEELGVDPGPELQVAHQEVLAASPRVPVRRPPQPLPTTAGRSRCPHQLPLATVGFIGRDAELARIVDALGAVPVVVTGTAGVGKTALVVQAAHQAAARFPDGQLYAGLGTSAAGAPRPVRDVLAGFVRALGVEAADVPEDEEDLVALYRSALSGRRVLVVLDDVGDVDQARALLPGSAGCGVLVTSREELPGLLVSPGARRIRLGELTPAEAARLLTGMLGERRVGADRPATTTLIALCAGLPLALRIAAAHLVQRPGSGIADYVEQARSQGIGATLHLPGDVLASMMDAFRGSYRRLAPEHRRLLRLLGELPAAEFGVDETAQLSGDTAADTAAALEALAVASLLKRLPGERYQMLWLLRSCVREQQRRDGSDDRSDDRADGSRDGGAGAPAATLNRVG